MSNENKYTISKVLNAYQAWRRSDMTGSIDVFIEKYLKQKEEKEKAKITRLKSKSNNCA